MTDTATKIEAAGFIVCSDEAIWATGATEDVAWFEFLCEMDGNQITLLNALDDSADQLGSWARRDAFRVVPASAALLAKVASQGGDIAWGRVGGVRCTWEEEEKVNAA